MELTDETGHRALAYVAAAQRQGYLMTVEELDAYVKQPGRRAGKPGKSGNRVVSTNLERAIAKRFSELLQPYLATVTESLAKTLEPRADWVAGTEGTPPESVSQWLRRLGWLQIRADDRVRVTPLGDAILAHVEQESLEDEIPVGVVLDQGDELATARVIQQIAEVGPCAVVDRYFSMESLLPILYSTEVEAVLMGSDAGAKLSGVETALRGLSVQRPFEVRKSDVFHDRFVIPPSGPVWALGTSLTGLGRRLSIMVRIDDERMTGAIRAEFREAWRVADVVADKRPELAEAGEVTRGPSTTDGADSGEAT